MKNKLSIDSKKKLQVTNKKEKKGEKKEDQERSPFQEGLKLIRENLKMILLVMS